MKSKVLYLIRHGLIQSNLEGVYAGRSQEGLTDVGFMQAEQVGSRMRGWGIAILYSSPLLRAVQTAEAISRQINARVVLEPGLIEMELGPWTGLSKDEVAVRYGAAYELWCKRPGDLKMDGMETVEDIRKRLEGVLNRFSKGKNHHIVAMITHAALIKCAFLHINRLPLNSYHRTHVPNLSTFRIDLNGDRSTIVRVI